MDKHGIGQAVLRVEDERFLTGKGQYVDDIRLPGMCHAVVIMSPLANARILSIDTAAALRSQGVLCVLTGRDALDDGLGGIPPPSLPEDFDGKKIYRGMRPLLANDTVCCMGDRVAMVVARTAAQARDAAALVLVEYDPPTAAVAADAAFSGAAHITALTIHNNPLSANHPEPRAAIGCYDASADIWTLYTSSQNPLGVRRLLAAFVFHLPEERFRVISADVGCSFGMKADAAPEDGLVLWAARRCGLPVKWVANVPETITSASGLVHDSGDFPHMLKECLVPVDWRDYGARREQTRQEGKLRGHALPYLIEQAGEAGSFTDGMGIRFERDDTVTIIAGTHSSEQGHATAFAWLVADWLAIPFEAIRYAQVDTTRVPAGQGAYAACSATMACSALKRAAQAIIEQARPIAAYLMDTEPGATVFQNGAFRTEDDEALLSLQDLAQLLFSTPDLSERFGDTMEAFCTWSSYPPDFPNCSQV